VEKNKLIRSTRKAEPTWTPYGEKGVNKKRSIKIEPVFLKQRRKKKKEKQTPNTTQPSS